MPEIEHNAPKFQYRVYWKQDKDNERWKIEDIADWRIKEFVINHQPTFEPYRYVNQLFSFQNIIIIKIHIISGLKWLPIMLKEKPMLLLKKS